MEMLIKSEIESKSKRVPSNDKDFKTNKTFKVNEKLNHAVESNVLNIMKQKVSFKLPQEDIRSTKVAFDMLKLSEFSNSILSLIGFSCAAISSDIEYSSDLENGYAHPLIYAVCSTSTAMLILSIIWRTHCTLQWEKGRALYSKYDTLFSSGKFKTMVLEIVLNIFHPVWFLEGLTFISENTVFDINIHYHYNDMLAMCTIIRIYHIIRLYSVFSKYRTERAYRICNINGKFAGTSWAVKCLMNDDPLTVVFTMMITGILIGGFCLRIFERPLGSKSGMDFSDYGNSMWCVILTMTTVGYGDYYPSTLPGRIIGLLICIWGVFVVSFMVVSVTNMLNLADDENKALGLYQKLEFRDKLKDAAARMLFYAIKYKKIMRMSASNEKLNARAMADFQCSLKEFQKLRLRKKILYNLNSAEDNIDRRINHITMITKRYNENMHQFKRRLKILAA